MKLAALDDPDLELLCKEIGSTPTPHFILIDASSCGSGRRPSRPVYGSECRRWAAPVLGVAIRHFGVLDVQAVTC